MLILIVFGDKATLMLVRNQIKSVPGIDTILESNCAEDALFQILEKKPQLVISSDVLPGRSGFELAKQIYENEFMIPFIILSNDSSQVVEAIRSHVSDFLVYPFSSEKLISSINKAVGEFEEVNLENLLIQNKKAKIRISTIDGFKLLDVDLLTHCKADGAYTKLYFSDGVEVYTSYYLGKIENVLKEYKFVRINRSTIINLRKIKTIDWKRSICMLDTGTENDEFKITKFCLKKLEESNII
jgi:DNA-binding LytR/AlgR family response regulator